MINRINVAVQAVNAGGGNGNLLHCSCIVSPRTNVHVTAYCHR